MADEKRYTPSVSLTKSEKETLENKAQQAGISYTRYMREVALGDLPQDATDFSKYDQVEVLRGLKNEINRAGNNLNQLTRVANQTGAINSERLDEIRGELYRLKMEILNHLS